MRGYCPMGCGETLVVHTGTGNITCAATGCPDRDALAKILADPETEHVAVFDDTGFSVQHPLRERIDGELFDCDLWERLRNLSGPPDGQGRFRVTVREPDGYSESYRSDDSGLHFERIA